MIFGSNNTTLGASTIPMAEGYDCSYGIGLALVESARNDLAMFQALVQADYKEMAICKESADVIREGEIASLHEAVGGGIFKKIAELFKKLVAKVKAIFHNFMAKINGLTMKDKELVKKYSKELARKRNLDKLEIKFRKVKGDFETTVTSMMEYEAKFRESEGWTSESWDRVKVYLDKDVDSVDEYMKEKMDDIFEDEDMVELKDIGGWRELASTISESKLLNKLKSVVDKSNRELEKLVNDYDKKANAAAKESLADKENEDKANAVDVANKAYDMAQAYQTAVMAKLHVFQSACTLYYKQCKAGFMKAVTVGEKKLEESSILVDAIVEAAEEEVDKVINSALNKEDISDLCAASTDVKDADVCDDPDKLTYGPDKYTDDARFDTADGVKESAYFGKMFY